MGSPLCRAADTVGMMADVTTLRSVALGVLLALVAVVVSPARPAHAHAALISTYPDRSSVVTQAPTQVVLTFTEPVTPVSGRVVVVGPDGARADRDAPSVVGTQMLIPLRPDAPRGTYLVSFRVISADSHPVAGSFTFSVGAPSTPPTLSGAAPEGGRLVATVFPMVRWIGYVGLLLLVGAALVLTLLWPRRLDVAGPARVIWLGAGLVALATIGELVLEVPYLAGGGLGDIRAGDIREVLASRFGAAHLVRLGALAAAMVLLRPVIRGKGWGGDRALLGVLGAVAISTWSVSGHPSASPVPMVTIVADMIHLASMSVWLGGLVMLMVFLLPRANETELGAIVPVWSRWAAYAVATLVLTGTAQALIEVGTVSALFSTTYGRLVIAKVGLVAAVVAVASFSRRLVGTVAAGTPTAAGTLRRFVIAETVVAALILGVTSVLVQTTPARTVAAESTDPTVLSAVLTDPLYTLTVDVQPATVGINDVHLYVTTPDGQPADIKQWRVRASLPAQGIEPIDAAVLPLTPSHATGQITLPTAGRWTFVFTLRLSETDQSSVTADFTVRQ
jgi:copper transport protein